MRASRLLIVLAGGILGLAAVLTAAVVWQSPARSRRATVCVPYFLIPQEKVCGRDVFLFANGRKMWVGPLSAFAPMPAPRRLR